MMIAGGAEVVSIKIASDALEAVDFRAMGTHVGLVELLPTQRAFEFVHYVKVVKMCKECKET
jgi:hypothetical protein